MPSDNPKIEELFTDTAPFNEESAIKVIKHFVLVQRGSNEVFLTKEGQKLGAEDKILVIGVVKKLLKRGKKIESDNFSRGEVLKLGLKKGTVDGTLNRLKTKGYILPGEKGKHEIPNIKVDEIIEVLEKKLKKDEQPKNSKN